MTVPADLRYSTDHEWVRWADGVATVGITAYAVDALGDVVYLGLPEVGAAVVATEACGEVESTKSVSDLYSPVSGTIVEVNDAVIDAPGAVNRDPYEAWLFRVQVEGELEGLLDARAYADLVGS